MGGVIFIVIKYVHINELYYNFYFIFYLMKTLWAILSNVNLAFREMSYFIFLVFFINFTESSAEAMLRQCINLLYLLLIEGAPGAN